MSIALPAIDLSSAVVGTKGTIDLKNTGYTSDPSFTKNQAQLKILNESGCGLQITTRQEGHSLYVPAGAWPVISLIPGESNVDWVVIYLITNPPVSQLLAIYYAPNEPVDSISTLGNSPVGGAVTSGGGGGIANQLLNVGNSAPTNVIDVQQAGSPSPNITADNSGNFSISQYVASTLTQLLAIISGATAGNPNIVIGDASHTIQLNALVKGFLGAQFQGIFAGQSAVVQAASGNNQPIFEGQMNNDSTTAFQSNANNANVNQIGFTSFDGATKAIGFQANSSHLVGFDYQGNVGDTAYRWNNGRIIAHNVTNRIESTSTTDIAINAPTGQKISFDNNLTEKARVDANGLSIISGTLTYLSGSISRIKFGFQAIASGGSTVTHNLGATPQVVFIQNGSATGGITYVVTAAGSTTFQVTPTPATATNVYWAALSA